MLPCLLQLHLTYRKNYKNYYKSYKPIIEKNIGINDSGINDRGSDNNNNNDSITDTNRMKSTLNVHTITQLDFILFQQVF